MAINNVGSYNNYATARSYRPIAVAPVAPAVAAPTGGTTAAATNLSAGRLASWAGGAFAAWKYVMPMLGRSPGGLIMGGVIGAGAYAGNWVYNKLTGSTMSQPPVGGSGTSEPLKYASWAGGAFAAWKWALPLIGRPTTLVTAGVLGAGAFAGNWVYNKLTGR